MHADTIASILAALDSLAASLRTAAAVPPPPPPQPENDPAMIVADVLLTDERENILDRLVDRMVDDERLRNAAAARASTGVLDAVAKIAADQVDHDAVAERIADKIDECDVLDRIDFEQMADNFSSSIDESTVIDSAAEQIAGQVDYDKVIAAAATKLAEQIMAKLLRA
jgi:hypothetical protein